MCHVASFHQLKMTLSTVMINSCYVNNLLNLRLGLYWKESLFVDSVQRGANLCIRLCWRERKTGKMRGLYVVLPLL